MGQLDFNSPLISNLPLPRSKAHRQVLSAVCHKHGGVLFQDLASYMQAPPSIKSLMSLLLTLGLFFSLEVGQALGLQACGVQPNTFPHHCLLSASCWNSELIRPLKIIIGLGAGRAQASDLDIFILRAREVYAAP